jgi:cellulose synthase/poly-beta-1,6-N-acetylglucosamine synthase-like glycosyltransferase
MNVPASPDVSIIVATRNRPAMLRVALESIARQTFQHYEVLVADDGSDPQYEAEYNAVFTRLGDRFLLLRSLPSSRLGGGPAAARNRGLASARGRYIAFLDDDDAWTCDDHLRAAVESLDASGANFYCANMEAFRGQERVIERWFDGGDCLTAANRISASPPTHRVSPTVFLKIAHHRVTHPNMLVVSRTLLDEVGGFAATQRFGEDAEVVLKLLDRTSTILYCPRVTARYRLPEGDAHSLTMSEIEQDIQMLAAARRMSIAARSAPIRRAAADLEGWTLRVLSRRMKTEGRAGAAFRLALQALIVYPTPGALVEVAGALLPNRPSLSSTTSS